MKKLKGAESKLEKAVQRVCNGYAEGYDNGVAGFLKDLAYGGCISGLVGELIYYTDTIKFFKTHKAEITKLIKDTLEESCIESPAGLFGDKWDKDDFFCEDTNNQNLLAWFAFEETARNLGYKNGLEE